MADFKTLTRFTEAYNTKRGKEFQADLQGFIGKDAEVSTAEIGRASCRERV